MDAFSSRRKHKKACENHLSCKSKTRCVKCHFKQAKSNNNFQKLKLFQGIRRALSALGSSGSEVFLRR